MLTIEQKKFLQSRIDSLKSKQLIVGIHRCEGIQRTIDGMRKQLREDVWNPPKLKGEL